MRCVRILLLILLMNLQVFAGDEKIGDNPDGNRSRPVHVIPLIDPDSSVIWPDEQPLLPFSTERTCETCHDYNMISSGWHFNAGDSGVADGRPGQPWIYVDPYSATQIPLSLRKWKGLYRPDDFGMTHFDFIVHFGRHMPGSGGDAADEYSLDRIFRWRVSGQFEINCLGCHDAERNYNQAEYAAQIQRQNFRWAATAASGFGAVTGSAKDQPDNYDIYGGVKSEEPNKIPPTVTYDSGRFNEKGEVFIDITRRINPERCYFCHSSKTIDAEEPERWHHDEDIHLTAGMICTDCHRNGLDHQIIRGSESVSERHAGSLTCEGCHIGLDAGLPVNGRLGAPQPEHAGIPVVHFDKLTCTACHSGLRPKQNNILVKTSMGHSLGMHKVNKSATALPHILSPVMIRQENGQIAPHNLIWPSFWAEIRGDSIVPLAMDISLPVARKLIAHLDSLGTGNWPALADSDIVHILDSLRSGAPAIPKPVFVSGGRVFQLNSDSTLTREKHDAARPYAWPVGHDVRPAAQSLGATGCGDCHALDSPFYFGKIAIDDPLNPNGTGRIRMAKFMDQNTAGAWVFSFSFFFRPWLKYIILISCLIIAAVVILYAFKGLSRLLLLLSQESIHKP